VDAAGSAVVARQIGRVVALPFASPSGFVLAQAALPAAQRILAVAQEHHRAVVEAIEHREGARAEALMREHARLARRNLEFVLRDQDTLRLVPGGGLIRHAQGT
jgi:GntR family transcriptional regulator of vanillate catabolism